MAGDNGFRYEYRTPAHTYNVPYKIYDINESLTVKVFF